jgi:hypothetical protein
MPITYSITLKNTLFCRNTCLTSTVKRAFRFEYPLLFTRLLRQIKVLKKCLQLASPQVLGSERLKIWLKSLGVNPLLNYLKPCQNNTIHACGSVQYKISPQNLPANMPTKGKVGHCNGHRPKAKRSARCNNHHSVVLCIRHKQCSNS